MADAAMVLAGCASRAGKHKERAALTGTAEGFAFRASLCRRGGSPEGSPQSADRPECSGSAHDRATWRGAGQWAHHTRGLASPHTAPTLLQLLVPHSTSVLAVSHASTRRRAPISSAPHRLLRPCPSPILPFRRARCGVPAAAAVLLAHPCSQSTTPSDTPSRWFTTKKEEVGHTGFSSPASSLRPG